MFPDEDYIDFKYRKWLFACQSRVPDIVNGFGGHCYQLECPLCGAPKSHLKWMPHKRTWKFICSTRAKELPVPTEFPCAAQGLEPRSVPDYQQERLDAGSAGAGFNCPRPSIKRTKRKQLDLPKRPMCQDQSEPTGISTSP